MTGAETFAVPYVGALIRRTVDGQPCVLLQERRKPGTGVEDGLLELPAGKLREYENVFDALYREIREETGLRLTRIVGEDDVGRREVLGYDVQSFTPYCVTQNLSGGYSILLSTFLCEAEGEAVAQPGETAAPRWVLLSDLRRMLEQEPERFFPLHLGALRQYLAGALSTAYVFVYGTLRPGRRNAAWASAAARPLEAAPATLRGFALHHLGAYPGALPEPGAEVRGTLYRYPAADIPRVLAKLDELEDYVGPGHPENLYHRELCEVTLPSGELRRAWTYVYARPVPAGCRIDGGEWSHLHEH